MDNMLVLLHYLANNHASNMLRKDEDNPYSVAYRALDVYLALSRELDTYGERVRSTGGFGFEEANQFTERLSTGFETGLINLRYGSTLQAAISFMQKYLDTQDIDKLIDACHQERKRMEREEDEEDEARAEEERQAFLKSGEAIEDQ